MLNSILRISGYLALGLGPMLFLLAGIRIAAPDGTLIWEPPSLPSFSVMVVNAPAKGGVPVPQVARRLVPTTPPVSGRRRPVSADI